MPGLVSPSPAGRLRAAGALAGLALAATGAAACEAEPSLLCDRVRVVWPYFNLDPSQDTSPEEGLQIDLLLRTSLLPGTSATLTVQAEEGDPVPHPDPAVADENGDLLFRAVTVPLGRISLELTARNECGETRSTRTPFVWDGLGYPICDLDLGVEPAEVASLAPLRVLRAEQDADPDAPGVQLRVSVRTGRPDVMVALFALDRQTGEQQILEQESGEDLAAAFDLTLGEGEQAVRSVCAWEEGELRPSSPTLELLVDTEAPGCRLLSPKSRVGAADDLDPDAEGVQFEVRGRVLGTDVEGEAASFAVQGEELAGTPLDAVGESAAQATLFLDPPGSPQEVTFRARDHAGNPCEDTVVFP